jgi:hypothetical protein
MDMSAMTLAIGSAPPSFALAAWIAPQTPWLLEM